MNDDARQLLRSLLDPRIAKFVDWRKFLHSSEFELMAKSQVDHFIKHGDSTRIKLLLDAFGGSKSYKPLLLWFCDTAGLDPFFSDRTLVLKRNAVERPLQGDLKDYLAKYSGTARELGGAAATPPSRQQVLQKLFNPERRRGGSPYVQGGAPGLGKRG